MKTMTQLQDYNECLILKVIETLFRYRLYRAVSTTSDLGRVVSIPTDYPDCRVGQFSTRSWVRNQAAPEVRVRKTA